MSHTYTNSTQNTFGRSECGRVNKMENSPTCMKIACTQNPFYFSDKVNGPVSNLKHHETPDIGHSLFSC